MIDGNQLREEFGRYLAEHKATRWGMDAALMHVCKIAYDAGKADGLAAPATAQAEVPMPKPVAYGFGNTAITGHTNRLMMVRIDIPGDDQYAGSFWLPLVLADEAHTYGIACRAAGEAAGYARGLAEVGRYRWLRDVSVPPHNFYLSVPDEFAGVRYAPTEVDAAIDASIDALRGEVK